MREHVRTLVAIGSVTALVGLAAAFGLAAGLPSDQRSFAAVSAPVQLLISVGVPFLGVVMTYDLHRRPTNQSATSPLLRALALAAGFAIFGVIATATAVSARATDATQGRWDRALLVVLGSVLVQVIAQLTGTGWGLLIRRPVLACLATVVVPLGLWFILGELAPPMQAWLTPLESASHLSAGTMTASSWLPFAVMVGLWGVGLNLAGYQRLLRSAHRGDQSDSVSTRSTAQSPCGDA